MDLRASYRIEHWTADGRTEVVAEVTEENRLAINNAVSRRFYALAHEFKERGEAGTMALVEDGTERVVLQREL